MIFIAHPGLQHSHQLAWAVHERGLLQTFWSGVPVLSTGESIPFWLPKHYAKRLKSVDIPSSFRKHPLHFQALIRGGSIIAPWMPGDEYVHRVFHFYDWWISRQLNRLKPSIVVAYENSAYHTFIMAKKHGIRCVLDAASLHYSAGMQWQVDYPSKFRNEINRRKDVEVDLADLILTCSPLAAASYEAAGVPAAKLQPLLLGADLPEFINNIKHSQETTLHYVFAGALSYRKSIDIILATFKRLNDSGFKAKITFVGGLTEPKWLSRIEETPNAYYKPSISQQALFELFSQSDCLILPSRFDSFGMVVAEAMACGTPAIVSTLTGAKAIIEQFPGAGWILEPDVESLYNCILGHIDNRQALFDARKEALFAASHFTWEAYRQRVGQVMQDFSK